MKKRLAYEATLNQEYYDKLSNALAKLHSDGNAHTEYVKEVFFKVLDKVPQLQNFSLDVNSSSNPRLAAVGDKG